MYICIYVCLCVYICVYVYIYCFMRQAYTTRSPQRERGGEIGSERAVRCAARNRVWQVLQGRMRESAAFRLCTSTSLRQIIQKSGSNMMRGGCRAATGRQQSWNINSVTTRTTEKEESTRIQYTFSLFPPSSRIIRFNKQQEGKAVVWWWGNNSSRLASMPTD